MPKAVSLTADLVEAPQMMPLASTPARKPKALPETKIEQMPLQVRWPREEVRAVKIAAAQREQTVSAFMLSCFHAFMNS